MSLEMDITHQLLATTRLLERTWDEVFARFGITLRAYELLLDIQAGLDTTGALAGVTQNTPASITHKTKLLEDLGYLTRRVDPEDKRVWHFSLTPRGRELVETVQRINTAALAQLYAEFSTEQKQHVWAFLNALTAHLKLVPQVRDQIAAWIDAEVRSDDVPGEGRA
jgi:DNA-binding MarR family transcriptional regulator